MQISRFWLWHHNAIVLTIVLIYFTWFVHNFVNYKCHILKRNNACLMPLSTFVCVCVCVFFRACMHVCVSRLLMVKGSSVSNSSNAREQINDVVLKTLLSSPKSLHCYFRMKYRACLTNHFIWFTYSKSTKTRIN